MSEFGLGFPGSPQAVDGDEGEDDEPTRAAVYARTSSVNQKFGYSLGEQVRQCHERAGILGWEVTRVFRDEAESGKDTDRPAFQRLLECARAGQIDVVVFWKLDRLSRSILHAVQVERDLREHGVGLHSVTEQLDTTNAAGRFNFRNIANAAEFERDMIKQRTRMGLRALALDHRWPNDHPPLGYEKDEDGRLVVLNDEAGLVAGIFERYLEESSMPAVADALNRQGVSTKAGGDWSPRAVRDVLTNRIYIGEYSVAGVEDYIAEYRILDDELFERAREVRRRFTRGSEPREPMPAERKSRTAETIVSQYREYLGSD